MRLEECVEHADECAQEVVNVWGQLSSAGHAADFTPEFKALFEKACRYRTVKENTDGFREVKSARGAGPETATHEALFAKAIAEETAVCESFCKEYLDFREKHELNAPGK